MTTYSCQLLLYFVTLGVFSIQGIQGALTATSSDFLSARPRPTLAHYLTTPNPVHWLVMAHGKTFTAGDVAKVPSLAHAPDICSLPQGSAVMSLCRWGDSLIGTGDATDVQRWADTMVRTMRPPCRECFGSALRDQYVEGALREHFVWDKANRDKDRKYKELEKVQCRKYLHLTEAEIEARRRILGVLLEEASGGNGEDLAAKIDAEMKRLSKVDEYLAEGDSTYK